MERSVIKGTIKDFDLLNRGDKDYTTSYIEAVRKRISKNKLLYTHTEIITEDVMLKYCCFCGKEL